MDILRQKVKDKSLKRSYTKSLYDPVRGVTVGNINVVISTVSPSTNQNEECLSCDTYVHQSGWRLLVVHVFHLKQFCKLNSDWMIPNTQVLPPTNQNKCCLSYDDSLESVLQRVLWLDNFKHTGITSQWLSNILVDWLLWCELWTPTEALTFLQCASMATRPAWM